VFAEVAEGMEVVDLIAKVKTGQHMGHGDVPLEAVLILEVSEV
jgi:peptidyl-prolyl cis-trans isomerase B (cyclophilin B)